MSATLTDRTIDQWNWEIPNLSVQVTVAKDDASDLHEDLYQFRYKNKGGDVETLALSSEEDTGWAVYGLAYIDSSITEPTKIYESQTLKINSTTITPNEDYDTYVYSSIPLYVEGYQKQSLKYVDSDGEENYPRILVSQIPTELENYNEVFETKTITINKNVGTYSSSSGWTSVLRLTYKPPTKYYYIFKIKNYFELKRFYFAISYQDF